MERLVRLTKVVCRIMFWITDECEVLAVYCCFGDKTSIVCTSLALRLPTLQNVLWHRHHQVVLLLFAPRGHNTQSVRLHKTKEIVFRRPNPKLFIYPDPLDHVHQVSCAKLLGVTFKDNFKFDAHINNILKLCSQRLYLLKLLRDQGIPPQNLNIIFNSLVLSRLQYALPAWSGCVNSLPKRAFKYGYTNSLYTLEALSNDADECLFRKIHYNEHNDLVPPLRASINYLRPKGHSFELPRCALELHKKSFLPQCLFKYV